MEEFESLLQANLRYTEAILLASTSLTSEIEQQCQRLKDLKDQQPELIDARFQATLLHPVRHRPLTR